MAKLSIVAGATSQSVNIFIQDSSVTTGAGLTGLVFNTGSLVAYYTFTGANATATSITLATLAAVNSAYSSGGFKEIDATNMPGLYRLDIPNAALATSKGRSSVIMLKGASNMVPCVLEVELTGVDNQDAVHFGITGIPNAAAGASGGLLISGSNSGTTTLGALTVTGTTTISDGLVVNRSSSNTNAVAFTGNGTGHGFVSTSGSGATGDGAQFTSNSTNGNGFVVTGKGTGNGLKIASVSGDAIATSVSTSGHGASFAGVGTTKHGINATGGATTSDGIRATGGGAGNGVTLTGGATGAGAKFIGGGTSGDGIDITTTSGDGLSILPTAGNAIVATANGTSKHGAVITGGTAGTSDGIKAVAGSGGVPIRGDITGNIAGNLSGSAGSVTSRVTANTDQLAGQTVTAAAGVTFPSSVASPTNITAGTITTATNLTTNNDKTGYALSSAGNNSVATAVFTNTMTESYPTKAASFTLAQGIYDVVQVLNEKSISGTAVTVKQRDQTTTAKTFTLNDATNPTSVTEAT